jgi:hypothetical protein
MTREMRDGSAKNRSGSARRPRRAAAAVVVAPLVAALAPTAAGMSVDERIPSRPWSPIRYVPLLDAAAMPAGHVRLDVAPPAATSVHVRLTLDDPADADRAARWSRLELMGRPEPGLLAWITDGATVPADDDEADLAADRGADRELGYRMDGWWGAPRFRLGFDFARRADAPDVRDVRLGRAYLGAIDVIARQRILQVSPGISFTPHERMTVGVTGRFLWSDDAALAPAGGGRSGAFADDEVGTELDISIRYAFDHRTVGLVGYSHFFAGDLVEESGSGDDMDVVYAQLQYTF